MTVQEREELKTYAWYYGNFPQDSYKISKIEEIFAKVEKDKGIPISQDYKDLIIDAYSRIFADYLTIEDIQLMVLALLDKNYEEYEPLVLADIINFYLKYKRFLQLDIMRTLYMFDPTMTREEVQQKISVIENNITELLGDNRTLELVELAPTYHARKQ